MSNLKFEYEDTTYNVPCMPKKEWGDWMLLRSGACYPSEKDRMDTMRCVQPRLISCMKCIYNGDHYKARKAFYHQCFPEEAPKEKPSCENCKNYSSKEEPKKELPMLTCAVFQTADCPAWAKYAAVDSEGKAHWYRFSPFLDVNRPGNWLGGHSTDIPGEWDASDWKRSVIARPLCSDYKIAVQPTLACLEEAVRVCFAEGWQPVGGATQNMDGWYVQALAKR